MRNTLRWDNLNREELKKLAEEQSIVVIPTGSTEQHGPALAVGSDAIIITKIAEGVAAEVNRRGKKCIVAPTIAYANSIHHMSFCGTITLQPSTYMQMLKEICMCIAKHGFRKIILINGHGGNTDPNNVALIDINETLGFSVFHVGFWAGGEADLASVTETQPNGTYHACEGETSLLLACDETLVDPSYKHLSGPLLKEGYPELARQASTFHRMEFKTPNGIIGNTYAATREKGERMIAYSIDHLSDILCCDALWAECLENQ